MPVKKLKNGIIEESLPEIEDEKTIEFLNKSAIRRLKCASCPYSPEKSWCFMNE